MAKELKPFDISSMPDLLKLAAELESSKQPIVLRRDSEDVAIVTPMARARRSVRTRPVTKDDPLWNLIGIGASEGPGDVSRNKHKYLAEASRHKSE